MAKTAQTGNKASTKATPAKVNEGAQQVAKDAKAAAETTAAKAQAPAAAQTTDNKPATETKATTNETQTAAAPVTNDTANVNKGSEQEQDKAGAAKAAAEVQGAGETGNLVNPNATQGETATKATEAPAAPVRDQAYLSAYGRYIQLYGELPSEKLSTDQLVKFNEDAETVAAQQAALKASNDSKADQQVKSAEQAPEQTPEEQPFDSDNFVMAERKKEDGTIEKKKFTKLTWKILQGSRDGWQETVPAPPEVQALKK